MFLTPDNYNKLIQFVLLNAYSSGSSGLNGGKAGMALALFEISKHTGREELESHAGDLLQHALVNGGKNISLVDGLAGIGLTLDYLIRNRFVDANFRDIFGKQQQFICHSLGMGVYRCRTMAELCEYFFYLCITQQYFPAQIFQQLEAFFLYKFSGYYDFILQGKIKSVDRKELAYCSSMLLYMNSRYGKYVELISVIEMLYSKFNERYDSWNVGYFLYKNGIRHQNQERLDIGKRMLERMIGHTVPQLMELRLKVNVLFYLNSGLEQKNLAGSEILTQRLLKEFSIVSSALLELKIVDSIPDKALYYGLGHGVCRLLCLNRFWDDLVAGKDAPLLELVSC